MEWVLSAVGGVLVLLVLRDIFHTLWHPSGQGWVSRLLLTAVWRLSQRLARAGRLAMLAGPLGMVSVVLAWTALVVAGWTLVYWPHMPEGFAFAPGMEPYERDDLLDSLYLSLVTVATLGFGDITPTAPWLRAVSPLQALVGFVLLTAAVSWGLQIYPALGRRRALAGQLDLLRRVDAADGIGTNPAAVQLLHGLATDLVQARVDLTQYAETYYFREDDEHLSLPATIEYAVRLANAARRSSAPEVRLAGDVLWESLADFARLLRQQFHAAGDGVEDVLRSFVDDHRTDPHGES